MIEKTIKEKFVTLRVSESMLEEIKQIAEAETRTISAQIVHFIKKGLVIKS